ncbi:MAG: class I SAM-dependent methyltransferase [Acidimicrobiales bacterium]|nr:class I SAM-dependent methyltransferase [Acidimicrobiales bacterium]
MADTGFWNEFYEHRAAVSYPSPFAVFAREHLLHDASSILELGPGNGRDAAFFFEHGHQLVGVDQSSQAIELCRERVEGARNPERVRFEVGDFTRLDPADFPGIDTVYSRFTLHSIDDEAEERLVQSVWNMLPSGGQFLIEARTILDPLYGKGQEVGRHAFVTDHFRRHIDAQAFIHQEIDRGYLLRFFHEGNGLAEFQGEDPVVMRAALIKP